MDSTETKEQEGEKVDHLWKTIQRFDLYMNSTNSKATLLIAFNALVVGAALNNWSSFVGPKEIYWLFLSLNLVLLVAVLASLVSLGLVLRVISPFLKSPQAPGKYHSLIFFGHVAQHGAASDYESAVASSSEKQWETDLAHQAHVLAGGLSSKFDLLKCATQALLWVQLPAIGVFAILKVIGFLMSTGGSS